MPFCNQHSLVVHKVEDGLGGVASSGRKGVVRAMTDLSRAWLLLAPCSFA